MKAENCELSIEFNKLFLIEIFSGKNNSIYNGFYYIIEILSVKTLD